MRKAVCSLLAIATVFSLVFCVGCQKAVLAESSASPLMNTPTLQPTLTPSPEPTPFSLLQPLTILTQEFVNSQNSQQNAAAFYYDNGWIYGQSWDTNGNFLFIKVRSDGSDWTELDEGIVQSICIKDNYIYYMIFRNMSDYGIYKMRTSGEDKSNIAKAFGQMQIVDNYLYYSDSIYQYSEEYKNSGEVTIKESECHLFRSDLNGGSKSEIIDKPVFFFYVFYNGILYQDDNDSSTLHIYNTVRNEDSRITDGISYYPIYDGDYIYYVKYAEILNVATTSIWKVHPDGTDNSMVADYPVSNGFLVRDNYIYFVYADDNNRIYRITKSGEDLTLITQDENVMYIQFLGEQLKYSKCSDDFSVLEANYLCNFDGSGKWEFKD